MLAVLGATLAPLSGDMYAAVLVSDKVIHAVLFGGVAALLYWNLNSARRPSPTAVLVLTGVFAAVIEVIQMVLPFRSGDLWDFIAGVIGSFICIGSVIAIRAHCKGKRQHS